MEIDDCSEEMLRKLQAFLDTQKKEPHSPLEGKKHTLQNKTKNSEGGIEIQIIYSYKDSLGYNYRGFQS